jgi:outer membrane protein assembly factor BamB
MLPPPRPFLASPFRRWFLFAAAVFGLWVGRAAAQTDGAVRWAFTGLPAASAGAIVAGAAVGRDGTVYFALEIGGATSAVKRGRIVALTPAGTQKWVFDTPDWVDSAPVVGADGTIYFGCWDSRLYALRPDGTLRWSYRAGGFISASPALGARGEVYFGTGNGNLCALDADGGLKWIFPTLYWIDSTPAVGADGTIYVGSLDNSFYAITPSGSLRWSYAAGNDITGAPALGADGTIYFGSRDQKLHALAPDGRMKWTFATSDSLESAPALAEDGAVIFATTGGRVHAVRPDGTEQWRFPAAGAAALAPLYSAPAVRSDGSVVFGSSDNAVFCLRPDGSQLWRSTLGDWADAPVCVAPDGTLYLGALDKKLYALYGAVPASAGAWPQFGRDARRSGRQVIGAVAATSGRLANLSVRAVAGAGSDALIVGFVVAGPGTRSLLLRAVGPTLARFGVGDALADPQLVLLSGNALVDRNDNWENQAFPARITTIGAQVGAFPLPANAADAALAAAAGAGAYTTHIVSEAGSGIALMEVYDGGGGDGARLANLSARSRVRAGGGTLIAGFVVSGNSRTLLIRAVGPALAAFGIPGVLRDPKLRLFRETDLEAENDEWSVAGGPERWRSLESAVGAFPLPVGGRDAALLVTLPPGAYTVQLSGADGLGGDALIEIYEVP